MPSPQSSHFPGAAAVPPLPLYPPFPKAELLAGLAAFAALGILFRFTDIDLSLARLAYSPSEPHWPGQSAAPWSWLYRFGEFPAAAAGLAGLAAFARNKSWRGPGLYLFLMLLLGPGLLVNVLGKNLSGRPRPFDLNEFGGLWEFRRVFDFSVAGKGKSFPSGHASMAFYWFCLFFLLKGPKRWLGFVGALAFGLAMGWARISQGGHFASDILLCGALMFALAACLSPLIARPPLPSFFARKAVLNALALAAAGFLLVANPLYEERSFQLPEESAALNLQLEAKAGNLRLDFGGAPYYVHERFQASLLPGAKERFAPQPLLASPGWPMRPGESGVQLIQSISGPFWRASGVFEAKLPAEKACEVRLKTGRGGITIGTLPTASQVLLYGDFKAEALPAGFEAYGMNAFRKPGSGPLIVLRLAAPGPVVFQP